MKNKENSKRRKFYFWQIKISFLCIILLSRTFFFPFIFSLDTFKQQEFPFLQLFIFKLTLSPSFVISYCNNKLILFIYSIKQLSLEKILGTIRIVQHFIIFTLFCFKSMKRIVCIYIVSKNVYFMLKLNILYPSHSEVLSQYAHILALSHKPHLAQMK